MTTSPTTTPKPRRRWLQFNGRHVAYANFKAGSSAGFSGCCGPLPRGTIRRAAGQVGPEDDKIDSLSRLCENRGARALMNELQPKSCRRLTLLELLVYPVIYEVWKWHFEMKRSTKQEGRVERRQASPRDIEKYHGRTVPAGSFKP